ncbi:uncharacterized protein CDAR_68881 [Caerostris darwini]|uniref:Nuclear mitotic apparatus protein 1 N-terminal hook domain-containing protein n=1 Tax=Caerostris darwini TaxID=1538125 RepID=A0AAV4R7Q2_9ARAC|nr:uncharacterized protein CDAR_68881 [Caerostris darwini]
MINSRKRNSILHWLNSVPLKDSADTLLQLKDAIIFNEVLNLINETISERDKNIPINFTEKAFSHDRKVTSNSQQKEEIDPTSNEQISIVTQTFSQVEEITTTSSQEHAAEETAMEIKETSDSENTTDDSIVKKKNGDIDSETKFSMIRKFLDDFYHQDSTLLIDYSECENGKEIELAKVAVLLLSAMTQCFLTVHREEIQTLTMLQNHVQEDIEELLSYTLKDVENETLKKTELHKILSRPTKSKSRATPRSCISRSATDRRNSLEGVKNLPKKRKDRNSVIDIDVEDIQNSSLRDLFESPKVQYRTSILRKNTEISKLREALIKEENKVADLTLDKKNLTAELQKKVRELKSSTEEFRKYRDDIMELENTRMENIESYRQEIVKLKESTEKLKSEVKELNIEKLTLEERIGVLEEKLAKKSTNEANKWKEDARRMLEVEISAHFHDSKLNHLKELVETLSKDVEDYKNVQEEYRNKKNESLNSEMKKTLIEEKHQEIINLKQKILDESEKAKRFESLAKDAEKERMQNRLDLKMVTAKMSSLQAELKKYEQNLETCKNEKNEKLKIVKTQLSKKEEELNLCQKELEKYKEKENEFKGRKELTKEMEKLRKESNINMKKYECCKKRLELEIKKKERALQMYMTTKKESEGKQCSECQSVTDSLAELDYECKSYKLENAELQRTQKSLEHRIQNLDKKIEVLEKEKENLEFRLRQENAIFSGNPTERYFFIQHWLNRGIAQLEKKDAEKLLSEPVINVRNTYILNGNDKSDESSKADISTLANNSVRKGFFQTDDEEDFLNHSSLAEIHNKDIPEDAPLVDRLRELQRRNTLCQPHLQSSYPLEIQNMTPSEKKYFDAPKYQFSESTLTEEQKELCRKETAALMGKPIDDDPNELLCYPSKKRKLSVSDHSSLNASKKVYQPSVSCVPASKKMCHPSSTKTSYMSNTQFYLGKPITPKRRIKPAIFKTPNSIKRLIMKQCSNKYYSNLS